jgi:hypothetical protein
MLPPPEPRIVRTPWGELRPLVDLRPLWYLLILYGVLWFLPRPVFEFWRKGEDGPAEWIQFAGYAGACVASLLVAWRRRAHPASLACLGWLVLAAFCFLMAGEEISWGERLTGVGIEAIRDINAQEETTIHNIPAVQSLMHFAFIVFGLLFGWAGWRFLPRIDALPARWYSLWFLPVALFYTYFDLSWITHAKRIRNDQEAIEVMMAVGLLLHAVAMARRRDPERLRASD